MFFTFFGKLYLRPKWELIIAHAQPHMPYDQFVALHAVAGDCQVTDAASSIRRAPLKPAAHESRDPVDQRSFARGFI